MSSIWISVHMDTSDHGLSQIFKSSKAIANGLTGTKCAGDVSLCFQLELNELGVLKCPYRLKSKGINLGDSGGCTTTMLADTC
jgi:hypothetical protein